MKISAVVFPTLTPCTDVIRPLEDGASYVVRNLTCLPHHYTASQSRRPWFCVV